MSIKGQGHSLILVKGHSDFKVKCLTFGLYTQVSDSGPPGPLVYVIGKALSGELSCPCDKSCFLYANPYVVGPVGQLPKNGSILFKFNANSTCISLRVQFM